jgi:hypothetical protein
MQRQAAMRVIRVFVSSPGDVGEFRDIVEEVADELNATLGSLLNMSLRCLRWERDAAPRMGRPQQTIVDQIHPDTADIFLGILWLRFGTPTGAEMEPGAPYGSGTEEEFDLAYESWRKRGSPKILFYRCTRPPEDIAEVDPGQLAGVNSFFEQFSADGRTPGLIRVFKSADNFRSFVKRDLLLVLRDLVPSTGIVEQTTLGPEHRENGFDALFIQSQNEARNDAKKRSILEAEKIALIAVNGYSYFSVHGHRFRNELHQFFDGGGQMTAIILNPWSRPAYELAKLRMSAVSHESLTPENIDPLSLIEHSTYYKASFASVVEGYVRFKRKYGDSLKVHLTSQHLMSTVLQTDKLAFFEPYLSYAQDTRLERNMNTFEVQCSTSSYLYEYLKAFMADFFDTGIEFDDFLARERHLREQFRELMAGGKGE